MIKTRRIVGEAHNQVTTILTSGEEVLYIAVQKKPLMNFKPDCVILTNKRFIIYRPSLLGGVNFEDHIWRDLHDAKLRETMLGAILSMQTVAGKTLGLDYLPKAQARRLYAVAQEMEEKVREERRTRDLEDKRAAAGGFVMHQAAAAPPAAAIPQTDPMEKLQKLKSMADAGLITPAEYEAKKAEILANL